MSRTDSAPDHLRHPADSLGPVIVERLDEAA